MHSIELGLLLLLGGGLAAWSIHRFVLVPLRDLRDALAQLAAGVSGRAIIRSGIGDLPKISKSVVRISDLLAWQSRQIDRQKFSLAAVLSSMAEGVIIVDGALRVLISNDALARMLKLERSPAGRTVIEVFRDYRVHDEVLRVLKGGLRGEIEILAGAPGERSNLQMHVSPLIASGERGAIAVFHDITHLRSLENARRDFVTNASHEFRTPLTVITGYVETLLDGGLEDRQAAERALGIMMKHCDRLNRLVGDMLVTARLETTSLPLRFERVNLREMLDAVVEQVAPGNSQEGAKIEICIDPEAVEADVDPELFERVLFNLLGNSLQHGAQTGAVIRISGKRIGKQIAIAFCDNGPGIPYEDQAHLFERFYRVRKDRSRNTGGAGLGLSVVQHAVAAHSGRVALDSTPGAGATFTIFIPAARRADAPGPESRTQAKAGME